MLQNDPLKDILPPVSPEDLLMMSDELAELRHAIGRSEAVVLAGGAIIAWWGICIGLGSFWNAIEQFGFLPKVLVAPFEVIAGYLGAVIINRALKTSKILKSWHNDCISTAWIVAAMTIPIFIIGCYIRKSADSFVMSGYECLLFALVTCVSAAASYRKWLMIPAAGWFIFAVLILFVANEMWRPFLFSFAALAFMTAPGIYLALLFQRERR